MKSVPYTAPAFPEAEMLARAEALFEELDARRSVRVFSDRPVPRRLIELAIRTASTAPSGAHLQPWTFVAVSDPALKRRIRAAAEAEERTNYDGRMNEEWRTALAPLGTGPDKPYLERAPWLVVCFAQTFGHHDDGSKKQHYYVKESVGIACGMLITALHHMGLCTLTHTPSPMKFLGEILGRPAHEKAYILFPVGYADEGVEVPDLARKSLDEVAVFHEG